MGSPQPLGVQVPNYLGLGTSKPCYLDTWNLREPAAAKTTNNLQMDVLDPTAGKPACILTQPDVFPPKKKKPEGPRT